MGVTCDTCGKTFSRRDNLLRHLKMHRSMRKNALKCEQCGNTFSRKDVLNRHIERYHNYLKPQYHCVICKLDFDEGKDYISHKENEHGNTDANFEEVQIALNTCKVLRKTLGYKKEEQIISVHDLFENHQEEINDKLLQELNDNVNFKCNMVLAVEMFKTSGKIDEKTGEEEELDRTSFFFRTNQENNYAINNRQNVSSFIRRSKNNLDLHIQDFVQNGSGWRIQAIEYCQLEIGACAALNGSCPSQRITISKPKDIFEIKKKENEKKQQYKNGCLLYCIAAYFTKEEENMQILDNFIQKNINLNISMPAKINQIKNFEKANQHLDFKINVLQAIKKGIGYGNLYNVYPLKVSPLVKKKHIINILWCTFQNEKEKSVEKRKRKDHDFLDECENSESESESDDCDKIEKSGDGDCDKNIDHYFLIKNISEFLRHQEYRTKKFICANCLNGFTTSEAIDLHEMYCFLHKPQIVKVPEEHEKFVEWKSYNNKFLIPYIGFFDFEAILKPKPHECDISPCTHKTVIMNEQIPISFSLIVLSSMDKKILYKKIYTGIDCVQIFIEELLSIEKELIREIDDSKPLDITPAEENNFDISNVCHICEKPFFKKDIKCRDHCHYTGQYLGASHQICNINRKRTKKIPLFCHNTANYDGHFIVRALSKKNKDIKIIRALPHNTEKFKTFEINSWQFLDSAAFMNCKLEDLANDLHSIPSFEYDILDQMNLYDANETDKKKALLRKGIYPYEYMSDESILKQNCLPPKEHFFSKLSNSGVSEKDYEFAQFVFKIFNCKNMQDYTELYCATDCALLAEIFCEFRREIYADTGLDIAHNISLPQFTEESMKKKTKVKYELMTDINQILMVENNIRGGVSYIANRHAKPENKNEEIIYIDANNLYGFAMSQFLPHSNFRYLNLDEIENTDWKQIETAGENGFILEVDLNYPEHLHLSHNSFPLAPEHLNITFDMLSPYAKMCLQTLRNTEKYSAKKLTATFTARKNYVVHFSNLKFYLQQGLEITKIHSVIAFKQEKFLEPYIRYCTEKRKNSVSSFQGSIYKTLSNSLFGKFLECVRDRMECKFVSTENTCKRLIARAGFNSFRILNEQLVAVFSKKKEVTLNKGYAIGFTILELSKLFMYMFYYDTFKTKFSKEYLLMTDTDSLLINLSKFEQDSNKSAIEILKDEIDFSNYHFQHELANKTRKNKLGFFKDEVNGNSILEFVGLRSKTYAIKIQNLSKSKDNIEIKRRTKGVCRGYRSTLEFDTFKECLYTIKDKTISQYHIRSNNHCITTNKVSKICFSSFDDKRFLLQCGLHSVPYNSCIIKNYKDVCPFCTKIL